MPCSSAARTTSAPKPLVTATRRTRSGSGAALAMRSRTAAMRSASVPVRGAAGLTAPRRTLLGGAAQPPLLQERGDVELVVAVEVEVVHRRGAGQGLELVVDASGGPVAPPDQGLAAGGVAVVPPVEPGGDDGHPHLVAHLVVDDRAEDDVGVGVGDAVDDLGGLVDLEQPGAA